MKTGVSDIQKRSSTKSLTGVCDDGCHGRVVLVGHLCVLTAVVVGSFVFVAIKVARRELGPVSLFLLRNNLAAALILVLWLFRRPEGIVKSWSLFGGLALIALLRAPFYQILLNAGAGGVSVGIMAILVATTPLHVSWLSLLFLGERIRFNQIIAMVVAFGGAILPVFVSYDLYFTAPQYPLMVASSALIGAVVIVLVRKMTLHLSAFEITTISLLIAAFLCLPLNRPSEICQWGTLNSTTWISVIFLVIGILVVSFLMFEALRRLPAQVASLYQFVGMILTVIWGRLLMAEAFDWTVVVSVILVATGLLINSNSALLALLKGRTFRGDKSGPGNRGLNKDA